jgi:hypothetical protein
VILKKIKISEEGTFEVLYPAFYYLEDLGAGGGGRLWIKEGMSSYRETRTGLEKVVT